MFVIHSLSGGGAENVLVNILKKLDRTKFKVILVLFDKKGVYLKEVPSDIFIYDLKSPNWFIACLAISKLSRIIRQEKPNLIFSFLWRINLMTIFAWILSNYSCKLIISERTHLTTHLNYTKYKIIKPSLYWLVKKLYPRVNLILCVTKGVKNDLVHNWGILPEKIQVIYNPVNLDKIKKLAEEPVSHQWFKDTNIPIIISVGRLDKYKGITYLIKAFHQLKDKFPARLVILGTGPEKPNLVKLVRDLSLGQDITFLGFQSNPYKYLKMAHVFVLASLYEGCPVALLEAMAIGMPIISTRCPSGPEEIIQDGQNGILVPVANEASLAEALFQVLNNQNLRISLSKEAEKRSFDFSIDKILKEYLSAIESVLSY